MASKPDKIKLDPIRVSFRSESVPKTIDQRLNDDNSTILTINNTDE